MPRHPSGGRIRIVKSWIEQTLRQAGERTAIPFAVRFAGRRRVPHAASGRPAFTLVFRHPRAYWRIAAFGHVGLLEAYFDGDLDVEGSLAKALAAGMEGGLDRGGRALNWVRNRWHELTHANASRRQAQQNAEFHYALTPEFYKLWLDDPLMLYTCAYWKDGTRTLEEAQRNKCDHVARKLLLKPGEEVVDVGSGFGGFMFHAHEHYGVKVTAHQHHRLAGRARAARDRAPAPRQLAADARRLPRREPRVRQGGLDRLPRARRPRPARRADPRARRAT